MQKLARILTFDTSPMRPGAWDAIELYPWIEAEDYQRAWRDGVEQADDENRAIEQARRA